MIQKDGVDIEMLPDDWKRTGHVIQACDFFAEKVFSCDTKNESDWNKQYAPDKGYGIALIKMYSTSMESVRNKQYGSITLKIRQMK